MKVALLLSIAAALHAQQVIYVRDTSTNLTVSPGDSANRALRVNVVAGGGAGGTSSTFGAAFPGTGTAAGFTDGTLMQPGKVSGAGNILVECAVGCSASAGFADNSAFTFGTTAVTPVGFVYDDVAPNAVTENRAAAPRMSGNRVPYAQLRDAAGNERGVNVTAANELLVSVNNATLAVTQSGTWTVQPGNTANTTAWKVDGSAVTQPVSVATIPSHAVTNAGTFAVQNTAATPAGAALIGEVNVMATATTTDSSLGCYIISAASTNSTNCKGSAGNFYGLRIINTTSTIYYLRLYNLASAPTCSSATGFIESIPIPHATGTGAGIVDTSNLPIGYTTGIGYCLTGGSSSTDNTNAATGLFGVIKYK